MKYKNIAYVTLFFSRLLVCSENNDLKIESTFLKSIEEVMRESSSSSFDNVETGRQALNTFSPGAPSFQHDDKKYLFHEYMMFGAASFGWAMTLYYVACAPKE